MPAPERHEGGSSRRRPRPSPAPPWSSSCCYARVALSTCFAAHFPPFPHFLGDAGGTLERKSGNRSFKASPVMSERVAARPRLALARR